MFIDNSGMTGDDPNARQLGTYLPPPFIEGDKMERTGQTKVEGRRLVSSLLASVCCPVSGQLEWEEMIVVKERHAGLRVSGLGGFAPL